MASRSLPEGRLQICLGNSWQDMSPEEDRQLRRAYASGQPQVRFEARGQLYDVDFGLMQQVNVHTGKVRALRFSPQMRPHRAQHPQFPQQMHLEPSVSDLAPPHALLRRSRASSVSSVDVGGGVKSWLDLDDDLSTGPSAGSSIESSAAVPSSRASVEELTSARASSSSAATSRAASSSAAPSRAVVASAASIIEVPMEACWVYPRWLHVWVPQGPVFSSGTYVLVDNMAHNSFPADRKSVV